MATITISHLSDEDLITETRKAAADERKATVQLVALLAEVDSRRLYLERGCPSMFDWCTTVLHLSEHAAYHRIEAARAARQFPVILDRLAEGDVTLTTIGLLRRHLRAENQVALLDAARHRSKRDVERLVAALAPKPDVAPMVRRLPAVKPLSVAQADYQPRAAAVMPPVEMPIAPSSHPLTLDAAGVESPAERLSPDRALTVLVELLERTKLAATRRPRPARSMTGTTTRHIVACVRRAVWARDGGRCTFVGAEGRCHETGRLEFHHITPYARGGRTDASNLTLRCRAHNAYEGRLAFGERQTWSSGLARE